MLEDELGPVVQRLILGERLRELRDAAGVELDEANDRISRYRGKLSKIENGMLAAKETELEVLFKLYEVPGPVADEVRKLGMEARKRATPERVPDWSRQYVALERAASEIRMAYAEVPGLLQTLEYGQAQLLRSPVVTGADVVGMAEARWQRGERLRRANAPKVWAVLGEEALYREVGGPQVLRRQLQRLREFAHLPNVSLHVLPFSAGASPALSCPFTLLYIERARATIAYVETLTGSDYLRSTGAYSLAFEHCQRDALPEDDTRALLDRRITDLDQ
ncbi:helix-turn-helix domain-containing protein [Gandjariella thermophila]|uniref:Transcriptional regulator n=1 Tax=Gandjariella thermophila TaxID=1931992 RepID=A0A4D4JHU3_9PSEU|nr:helix-turn-helix transcriptional regulator [Gandjariella thermophila]GDY33966.1 transcriptional regulator [Gandjariella thermophila]